jgi:hypothetical protein
MKKLLSILLGIMSINVYAQDTLCVMVTIDEVIYFDYQTSEVMSRYDNTTELILSVDSGYVMCIDFSDDKRRFRDVVTTFDDDSHMHDTFNSKENVLYTGDDWGDITIEISEPRKRK